MEDQLISFETAKLAKEKGFDEFTFWVYKYSGKLYLHTRRNYCSNPKNKFKHSERGLIKNSAMLNAKIERFSAPTQSLLQKWLREKYNIHIELHLSRDYDEEYNDWWFYLYPNVKGGGRIKFFPDEIGYGLSFEDVLEKGLQEALKLLPNVT